MQNFSKREEEILKESIEIFKHELKPKKIYLFGSRSKGTSQKNSDFDFAIEMDGPNDKQKIMVEEKIERISGLYKVDIIYLNKIDEEFKKIILQSGELLYEQ